MLGACREWWGWGKGETMCSATWAVAALPQLIVLGGTVVLVRSDLLIFKSMRPNRYF